jgi:trehalose utilization protein
VVAHAVAHRIGAAVDPGIAERAQRRVVEGLGAVEVGRGDRQMIDHR